MIKPLSTAATSSLNRVLLNAATRAERVKADRLAEKQAEQLAREVAELADELARMP
jgi:hypothetical protein